MNLSNKKRNISTDEKSISELLNLMAEGRFLIPSFQREFVWDKTDIIRLWDSIYRFYPIGSILCWSTDIYLNIHRRIGGLYLQGDENPAGELDRRIYILDGQQRVTSLLVTIFGGNGNVRSRVDFDFTMYFDAVNGLFFFGDEYNRKKREIDQVFLISLKDVIEQSDSIFKVLLKVPAEKKVRKNLLQLQHVFSEYRIPIIYIKGFDIPEVSDIFERVNREGKDLKSLDIMIARSFKNYLYPVEEDFPGT